LSRPALAVRIARRVRARGPLGGLRHALHLLSEEYNDRRLGIRTRGPISRAQLGLDPSCKPYAPISYRAFRAVMGLVEVRPGQDVFLDYGAGKGRVLALAATCPFRKIIGVEISPQLVRMARENIRRAAPRLNCRDITLVHSDAADFPLPDEVTVLHLFDPFEGEILCRVMRSIGDSLRRSPRRLTILYADPHHLEALAPEFPWLERRIDVYYPYFDGDDADRCKYTIFDTVTPS
jgi:SAM-dependent methyltransferase